MRLELITVTLGVIKRFTINLIPIMRAFKYSSLQELTGFNGLKFESRNISWNRNCGYLKSIHPLISCNFHGRV